MLCADGEVVWFWRPLAGVKLATMLCIAPMTVTKTSWTPGRARRKPLKPSRGECRIVSAYLWRLRSCASSICTRGRGCWLKHPAFPAPSVFLRDVCQQTSGASRRENAELYPTFTVTERADLRRHRMQFKSTTAHALNPPLEGEGRSAFKRSET